MPIYGLRFRALGQTLYHTGPADLAVGDHVLIAADQGQALAQVVSGPYDYVAGVEPESLTPIERRATEEDLAEGRTNEKLAREATEFCRQCIRDRRLDMKLVDVEVFFDRSKLIFYFTAPARIDFRELVKDLVREYRARIELRQIGVRHETQMVGAVGNCGMVCCCRRYLRKFAPVTIRMAKEQNLFLNPAKISGICGRLLCCLSYEQENYDRFHHNCPRLGKKYQTTQGTMKVLRANMFRNSLSVLNENNEEQELTLEEWQALDPHRPEPHLNNVQPKQAQQPQKAAQGDGLLVVSVTPENVDDPNLFADVLPPDAPLTAGPEAQPQQPAQRYQQPAAAPQQGYQPAQHQPIHHQPVPPQPQSYPTASQPVQPQQPVAPQGHQPAAPAPQESLIHPLLMRNGDSRPLQKPTTPLPSLDLLTPPPSEVEPVDTFALEQMARLVEARLADFRIKADVVNYSPGPVICHCRTDGRSEACKGSCKA